MLKVVFNKRSRFFNSIDAKVEITSIKIDVVVVIDETIDSEAIAGEAVVADIETCFVARALFFRSRRLRVRSKII